MKKFFILLLVLVFLRNIISAQQPTSINTVNHVSDKRFTKIQSDILNTQSHLTHYLSKLDQASKDSAEKYREKQALLQQKLDSAKRDFSSSLSHVSINGLGNIASATDQIKVDPTANIIAELRLSEYKRWAFYVAYNLGTELDSSKLDSIQLTSLFFPDKNKNGFAVGLSWDIFRDFSLFKNIPTLEQVHFYKEGNEDSSKFYFLTGEPYLEYSYLKKTINDTSLTTPRIQTSTWILGLKLGFNYANAKNTIAVYLNPYYKWVNVTDGTYKTFNSIFLKANNGNALPHSAAFFGMSVNLRFNKTMLSFNYEDLTTGKMIYNNDIKGGVFTLKATVDADVLNL